jgi:hypothetical protein
MPKTLKSYAAKTVAVTDTVYADYFSRVFTSRKHIDNLGANDVNVYFNDPDNDAILLKAGKSLDFYFEINSIHFKCPTATQTTTVQVIETPIEYSVEFAD